MRLLVRSPAQPIVLLRIDDSHCDRIHSSLTAVHRFDNDYLRKQSVAWKEYCAEYWLKKLQESMDRSTDRCDISGILLKMVFKHHTINQSLNLYQSTKFRTVKTDSICRQKTKCDSKFEVFYRKYRKHCGKRKKVLVTSIFFFSHNVFKRPLFQGH